MKTDYIPSRDDNTVHYKNILHLQDGSIPSFPMWNYCYVNGINLFNLYPENINCLFLHYKQ
jgi:hypothetical protein